MYSFCLPPSISTVILRFPHCPVYKPSIPAYHEQHPNIWLKSECVSSFPWRGTPNTAVFGNKQSWVNTRMSLCKNICFHSSWANKCLGVDRLIHMVKTCIFFFLVILRKCQAIFPSGCIMVCSQESWRSIPVAPHPCQHLMWSGLLTWDVWRGLVVV